MGQFFGYENVTRLIKTSSDIVTLPSGSMLRIGGQGYFLKESLSINRTVTGVGGLELAVANNTFYYVYAVLDNGMPKLIASTSAIKPTAYSSRRKVGAFFVNSIGQVAFAFPFGEGLDVALSFVNSLTTQGFGVLSNVICSYQITNGVMCFQGRFQPGTATGDQARVSIPESLWINADVGSSIRVLSGRWYRNNSSGSTRKMGAIVVDNPTTYFLFGSDDYTTALNFLNGLTGAGVISPGETVFFEVTDVPIVGLPLKADWSL